MKAGLCSYYSLLLLLHFLHQGLPPIAIEVVIVPANEHFIVLGLIHIEVALIANDVWPLSLQVAALLIGDLPAIVVFGEVEHLLLLIQLPLLLLLLFLLKNLNLPSKLFLLLFSCL